ncbi:MAG: protein-disulfide reductase DsbD N-terminal domain-containing protein [Fimbriimonadales bacterium]|nr:protein-disulfide reductase DsbD N-terminal domain-containing protein [Fimbriimonadales bacterium]
MDLTLRLEEVEVAPRAAVRAVAEVEIPDGFHAYAHPTSLPEQIPLTVRFQLDGKPIESRCLYPKGTPRTFRLDPAPVAVYEGRVRIPCELRAPETPGRKRLKAIASLQLCDDARCYPPQEVSTEVALVVRQPVKPLRRKP